MSQPQDFQALQDMATYAAFFGLDRTAQYFNYERGHLKGVVNKIENYKLKFMKFYKQLIWAMSTKEQTPIWELSDKLKIPIFIVSQILKEVSDKQENEEKRQEKRT